MIIFRVNMTLDIGYGSQTRPTPLRAADLGGLCVLLCVLMTGLLWSDWDRKL